MKQTEPEHIGASHWSDYERFPKAGGLPPAGVKLIGRWHGMSGKGFAVVETSDAKALFARVAEWSEFLPLETPVLDDAGAVLRARRLKGGPGVV